MLLKNKKKLNVFKQKKLFIKYGVLAERFMQWIANPLNSVQFRDTP